MKLDETAISRCVLSGFIEDLIKNLTVDVVVVGAGPAGLTASMYLAMTGRKVAVFERHPYCGGGLLSGGMFFSRMVVTDKSKEILEKIGASRVKMENGYYVIDPTEVISRLTSNALDSGAKIWNNIDVEDVVIRKRNQICGVVINWAAAKMAKLHVDPLAVRSKVVIDATGHDAEVARIVERKIPEIKFSTRTGKIIGEKPMWAEVGESEILRDTREVCPGLIVAGMAANAAFGSPRMGAITDGMLLSGKRAAEVALKKIRR